MDAVKDSGEVSGLPGPLVLIGAGKMGGALLEGWLNFGFDPTRIAVFEPQPPRARHSA
jgi:pyrroline-5-carboxylate reductase